MTEAFLPENPLGKTEPGESFQDISIFSPASVDLFFAGTDPSINLPDTIADDPRLLEQAARRRELHSLLETIFTAIPDTTVDIEDALSEGNLQPNIVLQLYEKLCDFIAADENNQRILLYLPTQILPDLSRVNQDQELEKAKQRFSQLFFPVWIRLLHEHGSRANFVDGDVLEPELGDPERISKAGHLTPVFLEKKIINSDDVSLVLESMAVGMLYQSLIEGILVANDRELIDQESWEKIRVIIEQKMAYMGQAANKNADFSDPLSHKISPERAQWLLKVEGEKKTKKEAEELSELIASGLNDEDLLSQNKSGEVTALAVIEAGKQLSSTNLEQAQEFAVNSESSLKILWDQYDPSITNILSGGLQQWARLGVINSSYLQKFGITLTDLSSPLQHTADEFSKEFKNLVTAAEKIKAHPILSQSLYPAFLVFGSRIKGYADVNADIDAALFFRPGANFSDREDILHILKRDIEELAEIEKFLEFWTTADDENIAFKKPEEDTRIFVGEDQVHFLMGGAWVGDTKEVAQIRDSMLEGYTNLSRFGQDQEETRRHLLAQMEVDMLQCRIMHKGYRKLYPTIKRENSTNSALIDWESDFWDPGFRRVATKLYLSRVFLPNLSASN